ncbi:MAG: hypothetical protein LBC72_00270 [Spirochaetaceae bacterium]|jgi:hypothetical protein|nr:hypothetical protein [Spirochaetaceae bacterium]
MIALGTAGFFLGWAQFAVPPGSYGVMRSRSHGLEPAVIAGGGVQWVWYKLIPANTRISVFSLEPRPLDVTAHGQLPQAAVYAAFAGPNANFDYEVEAVLSYSLRPEALPEIAHENNIYTQEELDAFLSREEAAARLFLANTFAGFARDSVRLEALETGAGAAGLRALLEAEYPFLRWKDIAVVLKKTPDFDLYRASQALYTLYIQQQNDALHSETARRAAARVASQFRLDELEKYGELITRYPFLIEYLKIESKNAAAEDLAKE